MALQGIFSNVRISLLSPPFPRVLQQSRKAPSKGGPALENSWKWPATCYRVLIIQKAINNQAKNSSWGKISSISNCLLSQCKWGVLLYTNRTQAPGGLNCTTNSHFAKLARAGGQRPPLPPNSSVPHTARNHGACAHAPRLKGLHFVCHMELGWGSPPFAALNRRH